MPVPFMLSSASFGLLLKADSAAFPPCTAPTFPHVMLQSNSSEKIDIGLSIVCSLVERRAQKVNGCKSLSDGIEFPVSCHSPRDIKK